MRIRRAHGLKRPKLRQSWNKYNLYNLSRVEAPPTTSRTFFQQKWSAKALSRAYHGETVKEKHWQRMFRRRLRAVVHMDPDMLARSDGYEHGEGRGSGLEPHPDKKPKPFPKTPYMNMTFAPLERRLDTAVFRAMFASSTRQARQFVVHGDVKVNGKKMIYPGYQLNPGDMFQVEPERVMFATGAPKDAAERRAGRKARRKREASAKSVDSPPSSNSVSEPAADPAVDSSDPSPKGTLQSLLSQARTLLTSSSSSSLSGKRKQDLRAFQRLLKKTLARTHMFPQSSTTLTDSLEAQLQELTQKLNLNPAPSPQDQVDSRDLSPETMTPENSKVLRRALEEARENPIDVTKPYATPWRPRAYMSAFAFIPRYLEAWVGRGTDAVRY
ncbi:MAG: hypothetical protein Q9208_001302 [Pyrenodesmia sp. 3 TL-2023]